MTAAARAVDLVLCLIVGGGPLVIAVCWTAGQVAAELRLRRMYDGPGWIPAARGTVLDVDPDTGEVVAWR